MLITMNIQILNVNEDSIIYAINGESEQADVKPVSLPNPAAWSAFHVAMAKAQAFLVEFPNDVIVLTTDESYVVGDDWGWGAER